MEIRGDPAEGDGGFFADAAGDLDFAGIAFPELVEGSFEFAEFFGEDAGGFLSR